MSATEEATMIRSKQWDVRGAVGLAGFFHFLHACASGCLLPFLTLYLRHLGLTAAMIGIIMATRHLVALVWRPLCSTLARRHNKRRMVIIVSVICSAAAALMLLLFPPTGASVKSERCNVSQLDANHTVYKFDFTTQGPQKFPPLAVNTKEPKLRITEEHTDSESRPALEINATYSDIQNNSETRTLGSNATNSLRDGQEALEASTVPIPPPDRRAERELKQEDMETVYSEFLGSLKVMDAQHQMFFLSMIVVGVWEVMAAPLEWTADDGLHEYLDFVDATDRHGSVKPWRLLGTAGGIGSTGILVGILYCLIGTVLHFYAYAMLMVVMVPVAALLPLYRHKRERLPGGGLKALQIVRGDSRALLCAITALLTGMAGSAVSDFLLWQMQDHSASELQMGITLALAPLCQAVFSPLHGRVARLLKSHGHLLLLGTLGLSLQSLYYSFLWTPWAALPAQLISGLTNGALWWSVEAQCADIASPGTERVVYRVFESLSVGLGAGLGSLVAGFAVQSFGLGVLFQGTAVMLALWCTALAALQWRIPRQRRINYSRLLTADASEVSESESDQENDWLEKAMEEDKGNNNYRRLDK